MLNKRKKDKMTQNGHRSNGSVSSLPYPYKAYNVHTFRTIPQVQQYLSPQQQFEITVVAQVFPFKTNSYVINELINWDDIPDDPIFRLTFPHRDMLLPEDFDRIAALLEAKDSAGLRQAVYEIRMKLNPHPAGQLDYNVPVWKGERLKGIQHKYRETVLFFPSQGQTCHAYCSFCFRWPQFVGMNDLKFAMREVEKLIGYLQDHPEVTDVLFTGGDPLIMKSSLLAGYLDALIDADLPHIRTIRLGTKSLAYWPYKFFAEGEESEQLLAAFRRVVDAGKHLAVMAHFNHYRELETEAAVAAIEAIRSTGAEIRTQSPVLRYINADPDVWARMWQRQVELGCIPYYMFVVRDTGAQHYFGIPLVEAWEIYRQACSRVSGIARTVRGPSMSTHPGKVEILGPQSINGQKVLVLRMLQGRNPEWTYRPFFAQYDETALWLDDLKPAFAEKFFFEDELRAFEARKKAEYAQISDIAQIV